MRRFAFGQGKRPGCSGLVQGSGDRVGTFCRYSRVAHLWSPAGALAAAELPALGAPMPGSVLPCGPAQANWHRRSGPSTQDNRSVITVNSLSGDPLVQVTIRGWIRRLRRPYSSSSRPNASSSSRKSSSLPQHSSGGVFAGCGQEPLPTLRPGVVDVFGRFLPGGLQSPGPAGLSRF